MPSLMAGLLSRCHRVVAMVMASACLTGTLVGLIATPASRSPSRPVAADRR